MPSLGVRQKTGAGGTVFRNRSHLKTETERALRRDSYACRCCGFRSHKYQRVVPSAPEHRVADDFITVCLFCEYCLSLATAGLAGSGVLIWLPEITQAELNHVVRAIYVARESGLPFAEKAVQAFDSLMARRTEAKKRLGSDDPLLLASVMTELLSEAEYAKRTAKLEGIRLLPLDRWLVRGREGDVNHFSQIIKYWRSPEGPFGRFEPGTWEALFDSVLVKTGKSH